MTHWYGAGLSRGFDLARWPLAAIAAASFLLAPPLAAGPRGPDPGRAKLARPARPRARSSGGWDCVGTPNPGHGSWGPTETALLDDDGSRRDVADRAQELAKERLLSRTCGDHPACRVFLGPRVRLARAGAAPGRVCPIVGLLAADYQEWLRRFDSDAVLVELAAVARDLLAAAREAGGLARERPTVLLGDIVDDGVPGGDRVQGFLRPNMERALQNAGALLAADREEADLVVEGRAATRWEGAMQVVQVSWKAHVRQRRGPRRPVAGRTIAVPATLLGPPPGRRFAALPAPSPGLEVWTSVGRSGSACLGEPLRLTLRSATERLHVRVIDLYGEDGALLMLPNAAHPSPVVPAGGELVVGEEEKLVVLPAADFSEERFLVVAAPTEAGLGPLAALRTPHYACRLPPALARELHAGRGIPAGARVAHTGFRIIEGPTCPAAPEGLRKPRLEELLRGLPACGPR